MLFFKELFPDGWQGPAPTSLRAIAQRYIYKNWLVRLDDIAHFCHGNNNKKLTILCQAFWQNSHCFHPKALRQNSVLTPNWVLTKSFWMKMFFKPSECLAQSQPSSSIRGDDFIKIDTTEHENHTKSQYWVLHILQASMASHHCHGELKKTRKMSFQ